MFGCCGSFMKCSDLGRCIYENDPGFNLDLDFEHCLYKENLDKGLNFYTDYNENNRKRAEEYKEKIEKEKQENQMKEELLRSKNLTEQSIKGHRKESTKTYIKIPNRLFHIGRRSSYNVWTYDLSEEERVELTKELNSYNIQCTNIKDEDLFIDEIIDEKEYCNCRVVVNINGQQYNISNYNTRGLKRETAVKIASYLFKNGITADIEVISGFSGNKIIKNIESKDNTQERIKKQAESKEIKSQNEVLNGQISLFDAKNTVNETRNTKIILNKSKYVNDYELMKGTKVNRICDKCKGIIQAGSNTQYYMRISDAETAPHIENIHYECMHEAELKKTS